MALNQNLEPFKTFPLISDQFDYIEFSLIEHLNTYTIVYTYIKPNHTSKSIDASCMIETGMVGFSYEECATMINNLLKMNLFKTSVSAIGAVFDEQMNQISEINWNKIQKQDIQEETTKFLH